MGNPQTLTTGQKATVGITIMDKGVPPVPVKVLPPGYDVTFESSDPSIVRIEERPDGLNADVYSDGVGTATVTIKGIRPDGTELNGSPDVTEVTVENAEPDSLNATWSAPEPEA